MKDVRQCSNGVFTPVTIPCPPPVPYYNPYENLPVPPEQGNTDDPASSSKGGPSISSGAVAGIIIMAGFIFFMVCLIAIKCRARFILSNLVRVSSSQTRNDELTGEILVNGSDMELINLVRSGLEEKLLNLLPVVEYVGLMVEKGKLDGKERQECAVCLSLFEAKELVRVLPKCHHIFHRQCIDKWFESHANCPLCRERITLQTIFDSDKFNLRQPNGTLPLQDNAQHDPSHQSLPDQQVNSPALSDVCVHNDHGGLACGLQDAHAYQNASFPVACAANISSVPLTADSTDQPNKQASGDHRNTTGFSCGSLGRCDQKTLSIAAVNSKSSNHGTEPEEQEERDSCAIYIGDGLSSQLSDDHSNPSAADEGSHGCAADDGRTVRSVREANHKTGGVDTPNVSEKTGHGGSIDHHTVAALSRLEAEDDFGNASYRAHLPACRISSPRAADRVPPPLLKKSLSTGSSFHTLPL